MSNSLNHLLRPVNFEEAYDEAVKRIAELNSELQQKDLIMDGYHKQLIAMKEKMDECIKSLSNIPVLLANTEANFKTSHDQLLLKIKEQDQVILDLENANFAWSERSIKLEFELLAAKNISG